MIDLKKIARFFNHNSFLLIRQIDSGRGEDDVRLAFVLHFADGSQMVIKACSNDFTTPNRVMGWQKIQRHYANCGVYCPQIINTLDGCVCKLHRSGGKSFVVYAEEVKKFATLTEAGIKAGAKIKKSVIESTARVAASAGELTKFPSVYCLYKRFCRHDIADENYENAQDFCQKISGSFKQFGDRVGRIWRTFEQKRADFKPIYGKLPKAVFQADLNSSNILVDEGGNFAGLIDFNLSGTESVLCYALLPELCLYELRAADLGYLNQPKFLDKCDNYLRKNLKIFAKHYSFSNFEAKHFDLCFNTVVPFCFCMTTRLASHAIKAARADYAKNLLDWVDFQLNRVISFGEG